MNQSVKPRWSKRTLWLLIGLLGLAGVLLLVWGYFVLSTLEGEDGTQKDRQQLLKILVQQELNMEGGNSKNIEIVALSLSANFCRMQNPKIEKKDCLNFALNVINENEGDATIKQMQNAISRICAIKKQCMRMGDGVVVLVPVFRITSYSGEITPYALAKGEVRQGQEFVYFLRSNSWN